LKEKLKALSELQKVDLEVAQLRKAHDVHPRQLSELDKELSAARSALEAERNRVADVERQKRTLEQNITDEKDKVKKWESRLAEQRSTREYSALAREIDIAKKANANMQDELIELGKQLAVAREALATREAEFTARQQQLQGRMDELRGKMGDAESQVKALEGRRGEAAGKVDRTLLQRYETVRKKRLPALVPLRGSTCSGCNMNLPPQLANQLRASLGTDVCPNCHRIIYSPEALGEEAGK
jgi:predicted  nucleic acid-binding Zn-ribbon protein